MRGVGQATAAITIVNALATGVGSAVGIDLAVRAEIELHPAGSNGRWDVEVAEPARTPLVIAALDVALNRFAPGSSGTGRLTLRSEIPAGRGLKSSSAVGAAIVIAVAEATDSAVSPTEVARLSAEVGRSAGVSATGAFDDALAGVSSGVVVTDNRRCELLRAYPLGEELGAALWVPPATHRPSPEWAEAFSARAGEGRVAADAALSGDWQRAMRANTELVERVLGYDYAEVRERLTRAGALAVGVTGMGPALAAIAARGMLPAVETAFPDRPGERRSVRFSLPPRPRGSVRP